MRLQRWNVNSQDRLCEPFHPSALRAFSLPVTGLQDGHGWRDTQSVSPEPFTPEGRSNEHSVLSQGRTGLTSSSIALASIFPFQGAQRSTPSQLQASLLSFPAVHAAACTATSPPNMQNGSSREGCELPLQGNGLPLHLESLCSQLQARRRQTPHHRPTRRSVLIDALSAIAQILEPRRCPTYEWIKKMHHLLQNGIYAAVRKSEVMAFSGQSGIGDRYVKKTKPERQIARVFFHICGLNI